MALIVSACTQEKATFLEGTWQSNKPMTILNFTENKMLTDEKREYLVSNLGELTLLFKGSRTSIYFEKPKKLELGRFEVTNSTEKAFTISVTNSVVNSKEFTYYWADGCFYLSQKEYGYDEYFCRV